MDESIINTLRDWAASKSFIIRLWVFGSRVKKNHRDDSDLDIAVQIGRIEKFYGPAEAWFCRRAEWDAELQARLPMKPHLLPLGC
jgi:predicted nucleotidyltransferase